MRLFLEEKTCWIAGALLYVYLNSYQFNQQYGQWHGDFQRSIESFYWEESPCKFFMLIILGFFSGASLVAQTIKNLPGMQETQVWSLGQKDSLEKEMATHCSILAWKIPWTEETGRLQAMGLQTVGHDWATNTCLHRFFLWKCVSHSLWVTLCILFCNLSFFLSSNLMWAYFCPYIFFYDEFLMTT